MSAAADSSVPRVGFVINSRVPELASLARGMRPPALFTGWDDAASPMSFMRFRWVAESLRAQAVPLHYELYRPTRHYAAVVFLKSMGAPCAALARRLRARGTRVLFEANVDYYTRCTGPARLDAMAPTAEQRADAIAITAFADRVIASSRHLTQVCAAYNPCAAWIPDHVPARLFPSIGKVQPLHEGRLSVWWSGVATKLLEFLAAEAAWKRLADRVHLHLVTDDVSAARARWPEDLRARVDALLARVPHTIHRFRDIPDLLARYAQGGVIVSPRFLDVPYNLSHTEWKITLGMAAGLPAIASPVPSYRDVAERAKPGAVTLCAGDDAWVAAIERFLFTPAEWASASVAAREVVATHYETGVVARAHAREVTAALAA